MYGVFPGKWINVSWVLVIQNVPAYEQTFTLSTESGGNTCYANPTNPRLYHAGHQSDRGATCIFPRVPGFNAGRPCTCRDLYLGRC